MKKIIVLYGMISLLVLIATAMGIFYQTPGSPIEYTTIRGEPAVFQGSGLYRYDPRAFAREGIIWDVINLFISLPLFIASIYLSVRNSLRGRLMLAGLLFYFFYVYLMAMTGNSLNQMFLVYIAIVGLSAVGFFITLSGIDIAGLAKRISVRFSRQLFIGFTFVVSIVLTFLWVGRILSVMATDRFPAGYAGVTTLQSQAIDLGIIVPLMLSTGILLWKRSSWGYLLTGVSLGYGFMMCITLPAWIVVPLVQDGQVSLVEAMPFLAVCLVGFFLAWSFYRNVQEEAVIKT